MPSEVRLDPVAVDRWPQARQRLTQQQRADQYMAFVSERPQPRQAAPERPGILALRREFQPKKRPPVQMVSTDPHAFEPLGEFPIAYVSTDDHMYVGGFVRVAARSLGVDDPWLYFYEAPPWSHRGLYSTAQPGCIYVRAGQSMAETLAAALHELAHAAGIEGEKDAEGFAMQQLADSIYGPELRSAYDSPDPLRDGWTRCLRSRGINA